MTKPLNTSIIRLSSDSLALLNTEDHTLLATSTNSYIELCSYKNVLKNNILDTLYTLIKEHHDPSIKKELLNLKRALYNDKSIHLSKAKWLSHPDLGYLPQLLRAYSSISTQGHQLIHQFKTDYLVSRRMWMKQLIRLSRHSHLTNAMVLSSGSLMEQIFSYEEKGHQQEINKKTLQTERSLIKYLTRMLAKTSPFSSLGQIMGAHWTHQLPVLGQWMECPAQFNEATIHSRIELNNYLWAYIKILANKIPQLCHHVPLSVNPSLTKHSNDYQFVINSQNIESIQTLSVTPLIEHILGQFPGQLLDPKNLGHHPTTHHHTHNRANKKTHKQSPISFNDLVSKLVNNGWIEAPQEDIEDYLHQLIAMGLLDYDWQVSGSDYQWDKALIDHLQRLPVKDHPCAQSLIQTLAKLRALSQRYQEQTDSYSRQATLDLIFLTFKDLCQRLLTHSEEAQPDTDQPASTPGTSFKRLEPTLFPFKPRQMIYEDNVHTDQARIDAALMTPVIDLISDLLEKLTLFDEKANTQLHLTHVFNTFKSGLSVDFLDFYQRYFETLKSIKASSPQISFDGMQALTDQRQSWLKHLTDQLSIRIHPPPAVINLRAFLLERANQIAHSPVNSRYDHKPRIDKVSYSAFIQPYYQTTDTLGAVINGISSGYGKLFSRFLGALPPYFTDLLRKQNQCPTHNTLWVENTDASFFNANLHPALMPLEIRIPGGHNQLPYAQQIELLDLEVRQVAADKVGLFHTPTNKRVYVFDIGLQSAENRSPTFQLLSHFNYGHQHNHAFLVKAIHDELIAKQQGQQVIFLSRISYEERLILARCQWLVLKQGLPMRRQKQEEYSYFLQINKWRSDNNIPSKVFVRLPKENTAIKNDHYKPQYIDFVNPLLINVFCQLLNKVTHLLIIEEMLPNYEQLLSIKGKPYVSEVIVQWQTPF